MKIGFYPGCSLNGTSREYNESVKALAQVMGLELIELKDWNCCGATAAHSMSLFNGLCKYLFDLILIFYPFRKKVELPFDEHYRGHIQILCQT